WFTFTVNRSIESPDIFRAAHSCQEADPLADDRTLYSVLREFRNYFITIQFLYFIFIFLIYLNRPALFDYLKLESMVAIHGAPSTPGSEGANKWHGPIGCWHSLGIFLLGQLTDRQP
ncbi:MAG: hypothetical protein QW092_07575, partial [Candidatus Korarchaeum sp.]